jgi:competence protein ComEC
MRRILLSLVALLLLLAPGATLPAQQPAPQQQAQTKEQTVYVTRTGKRYHRDGCRYLSQSRIPVSLKDAKAKGYTACMVCRPPQ